MAPIDIRIRPLETAWLAEEGRWKVPIEVRFENTGDELFELDKATACEGGRVQNDVFDVRRGRKEIAYQGMMKKRAHPGPDGFFRLEPGTSVETTVDLGTQYDFPASGGDFTIAFDHFNHFSPQDVQLTSEVVAVSLQK